MQWSNIYFNKINVKLQHRNSKNNTKNTKMYFYCVIFSNFNVGSYANTAEHSGNRHQTNDNSSYDTSRTKGKQSEGALYQLKY